MDLQKSLRAMGAFFFLVCLMCSVGCGGIATYPVSGSLEFEDGEPVMFGTIEFLNRDTKLNARGKINRDGSFSVGTFEKEDGAVLGVHEVTIQQFTSLPLTANQNVKIDHDHGKLVADKYKTYESSDLRVTIKKPNNELRLVVDSKD